MREVEWRCVAPATIERITQSGAPGLPTATVQIPATRVVNVSVAARADLLGQLMRLYPTTTEEAQVAVRLCEPTVLAGLRGDLKRATPYLGLYCGDGRFTVVGDGEFGILKSVVHGVASHCLVGDGVFPIHGALLLWNNRGVMIVGEHGSGKTHAAFELLRRASGGLASGLLTDDWGAGYEDNRTLVAQGVERWIYLDREQVRHVRRLSGSRLPALAACEAWSGCCVRVDDAWPGVELPRAMQVHAIVLLETRARGPMRSVSSSECALAIVNAAYHMPMDAAVEQRALAFWARATASTNRVQINTRVTADAFDVLARAIE